MIDISRIAALDRSWTGGDNIEIGAAVTQNKLMAWPPLKQKLPLVAAALPFRRPFPDPQQRHGMRLDCACRSEFGIAAGAGRARRRGRAALEARRARAGRRGVPEGHADHRARAGRTDHRRAFSGDRGQGRGFQRSGAAARRFCHRRGRGHRRRARRGAARRRRHGRPADGAQRSTAARPMPSANGPTSSKATRICTPRRRCAATCSRIWRRCVIAEARRCAA